MSVDDSKKKQKEPFTPDFVSGDESQYVFKIVVGGEDGVGKGTLFSPLAERGFETNYRPTLGFDRLKFTSDNSRYAVWIVSGKPSLSRAVATYFIDASICIILFDLTRRETFEASERWINLARQARQVYKTNQEATMSPRKLRWLKKHDRGDKEEKDPKLFLVGNKMDLPDRQVSSEEGLALAQRLHVPYFEISAKTRQGVGAFLREADLSSVLSTIGELTHEFQEWGDRGSR